MNTNWANDGLAISESAPNVTEFILDVAPKS